MTKGGGVCLRSPSHSEGEMSLWKSSGDSGLLPKLPGRFGQVTVSYGTTHPTLNTLLPFLWGTT